MFEFYGCVEWNEYLRIFWEEHIEQEQGRLGIPVTEPPVLKLGDISAYGAALVPIDEHEDGKHVDEQMSR